MKKLGITAAAFSTLLLSASGAFAQSDVCGDLDGSGSVVATDALRLLRFAVGQDVQIACPAATGACWDTNGNDVCDAEEDIDGDTFCGATDCRGPAGPTGPTGPAGT